MKKSIYIFLLLFAALAMWLSASPQDTVFIPADPASVSNLSKAAVDSLIPQDKPEAQKQDSARQSGLLGGVGENVREKQENLLESISFTNIFLTILLLIIGYYLIKLLVKILTLLAERSVRLRITIKGLIPVMRIVIWSIIIFAIIQGIYNPPIQTVIAATASVGIAVGFAAQDLLKNVFGGIALLLDRPFQVGDKIDTGKHYGEVIEIGLRATRVVTEDDSMVSVPNSELVNSAVSNANWGELNCQVSAEIYLPIDADTQLVRKIAIEAAQVSRFIYLNKPILVLFDNEIKVNRSFLKMKIKAYVMDIRYEIQFKSELTEIIIRELLKAGVISRDD